MLPFSAIAMAATIAPRIEIYTMLACGVHKPEHTSNSDPSGIPTRSPFSYGKYSQEFGVPPPLLASVGFGSSVNGVETQIPQWKACASDPVVQADVAKLTTGGFGAHINGQGLYASKLLWLTDVQRLV
jgi:hypothetical protein